MISSTEFDVLRTAADGMDAQRAALDIAARNVAAAQTTDGTQFQRLVPRYVRADEGDPVDRALADVPDFDDAGSSGDVMLEGDATTDDAPPFDDTPSSEGGGTPGVRVAGAVPVRGSRVDAVAEMVAVLDAERAYEANASVFDLGKHLAERTVDLERP